MQHRYLTLLRQSSSPAAAFTLIELLVVIAIIAILAAIAMPVIAGIQAKGKQAGCMSNMRQIGAALILYTTENNGDFPQTTHTTGGKFEKAWIYQLKPYLGNTDEVRISPADPKREERLKYEGTSYILNSFVFVPNIGPFGEKLEAFNNIRRLPYPANTLLAFNISDEQSPTVMSDHTHSERWKGNWKRLCAEIQPNRHRAGSSNKDNTNGTANYLYADGHVANIDALRIKKWVDGGVEFARVPLEHTDLEKLASK